MIALRPTGKGAENLTTEDIGGGNTKSKRDTAQNRNERETYGGDGANGVGEPWEGSERRGNIVFVEFCGQ